MIRSLGGLFEDEPGPSQLGKRGRGVCEWREPGGGVHTLFSDM